MDVEDFGILTTLINLTQVTIRRARCRLKIHYCVSDAFLMRKGLKQGNTPAYVFLTLH
jgi:hypothetical protein